MTDDAPHRDEFSAHADWWGRVPMSMHGDKRLKPQHRDVYSIISAFARWPKGAKSARADVSMSAFERIGVSRSKMQRWLPGLKDAGWIDVVEAPNPRGGRPRHVYIVWLHPKYRSVDIPPEQAAYPHSDTSPAASTYRNGDTSDTSQVSKTRPPSIENGGSTYRAADTVIEIQKDQRERTRLRVPPPKPVFTENHQSTALECGIEPEHVGTVFAKYLAHYFPDDGSWTRPRPWRAWCLDERKPANKAGPRNPIPNDAEWRRREANFRHDGSWSSNYGPRPNDAGYRGPALNGNLNGAGR